MGLQLQRASKQGTQRLGWSIAAAVTVTAVFVLSNAPTPLYVIWQKQWGFSSGMLTLIFVCYMIGLIATLIIAGRLADRFGRRIVLLPGLSVALGSSLLFLFAHNVTWLIIARLLAGIAVGTAVTAGMASVVDLEPKGHRRIGPLLASISMVLGAGLGPLLSGILARTATPPQVWIFAVVGALSVVTLIIAARLPLTHTPDTKESHGKLVRWPRPPRNRRRELLWGALTFGPGITETSFVLALGPSVLAKSLSVLNPILAGVIACIMFLAATGVQFAAKRMEPRTQFALSSLAAILAMLLLGGSVSVTPWWPVFALSAVLAGAAQGLGQLAGLTLIAARIAPEHRSESNAALNISGYIPAGLISLGLGYLVDVTGLRAAVLWFALLLTSAAIIALITVRLGTRADRALDAKV